MNTTQSTPVLRKQGRLRTVVAVCFGLTIVLWLLVSTIGIIVLCMPVDKYAESWLSEPADCTAALFLMSHQLFSGEFMKNVAGNIAETEDRTRSALYDNSDTDPPFVVTKYNGKTILHNYVKSLGFEYVTLGLLAAIINGFCLHLVLRRRQSKQSLTVFQAIAFYLWLNVVAASIYIAKDAFFDINCTKDKKTLVFINLLYFAFSFGMACAMQRIVMVIQRDQYNHPRSLKMFNVDDI